MGKLDNKEIDFVCEKAGERLYVQAVYLMPDQKVRDREFGNLLAIKDNFPKLVVSMDETAGNAYKGIKNLNIIDFLTSYNFSEDFLQTRASSLPVNTINIYKGKGVLWTMKRRIAQVYFPVFGVLFIAAIKKQKV